MMMLAPCFASSETIAKPMPLLPPVTMATLPLRFIVRRFFEDSMVFQTLYAPFVQVDPEQRRCLPQMHKPRRDFCALGSQTVAPPIALQFIAVSPTGGRRREARWPLPSMTDSPRRYSERNSCRPHTDCRLRAPYN